MNKIKTYLAQSLSGIVLYLTPFVITIVTLLIFQIDRSIIVYLILFCGFMGLLFIWVGWTRFQRQLSLQDQLQHIEAENQILKGQLHHIRVETEHYFLTWLHQMKTPISATQLLLRDIESDQTPQMRLLLNDIEKYTGMALSYIKLMNPGADLHFEKIPVDQIIQPLLKKYRYPFIYGKIRLEYRPILTPITTDAHWTSIMVEQILSNALKYTGQGGTIRIGFDTDREEIFIQDTGMGIQSADLTKIFDKGYVGFNGRLHEKASGLGLYLVKLISQRLDQPVRVTSVLHQGSTFFIKCHLTKL